jgi:homoserine kinase
MMNSFQIQVPGSTANLGPGFDSIGIALKLYLTLRVTVQDQWEFVHNGPNTPEDTSVSSHLIYKIAQQVAQQFNRPLLACKVEMTSELPLARGLGSSAAAIVAAIELANVLGDLHLTTQQKLSIASAIEGHPDNASASLLGGVTISAMYENETDTVVVNDLSTGIVVIIPNFELKTADARAVLPEQYTRAYSVNASANANMLVASLLQGKMERIGHYMEKDLFHEPFRASLIPHFQAIKEQAKKLGAYGTALSGAGPTLFSFVPHDRIDRFVTEMQFTYPNYSIVSTTIDELGVNVCEQVQL